MTSTYLRLAAPLQSWASARVSGNVVRTKSEPTTSALRGLVAASLGARRGEWPKWLDELRFTTRIENPGQLIDEFQTINPRDEDLEFQQRLFVLMSGKRWTKSTHFTPDGQSLTSIVRRTYLGDAEFLVEVHSPDHADQVSWALRYPKFTPYLGRKAFAPTFPYYLGVGERGLLEHLPSVSRADDPAEGLVKRVLLSGPRRSLVEVATVGPDAWLQAVRDSCVLPDRVGDAQTS